ncbi:MAG: VWA domain-containing protein [Deltaproteobacteria bacterium]|nr:VWA domain-containing protein [Deltaproteobacteria bacterium]
MSWAFPYAFFLLLGAIPLILFLHSLRPKGVRVKTTTLFLWERILRERPMGKRIGWLFKNNLLLILQLLAALILILALADPSLLRFGARAGDSIAVIDLSASMKARGRAGTRMDDARRELGALVDALPSGQRMMVVGAGPIPRVLSPLTADKRRLRDLGRSLEATDTPARVKEAVLFAHSFLKRGSRDRVVVISDGAFDGAEELPWNSPQLSLIRVEGKNENVGITGFEFRRLPNRPEAYEVMVQVRNFTARAVESSLALMLEQKRWTETRLRLAPHESRVLIYPLRAPLPKRAVARLEIEDDFALDNEAFLTLSEARPLNLLYVGKGNTYLERLFGSLPAVRVTRMEQWPAKPLAEEPGQYDVVIADGIPVPSLREGNFILINTVAGGLSLEAAGKIFLPRPVFVATEHPLTQGLRFDDLYIKDAMRLRVTGAAVALARAREGPLLIALERGKLRALVVGFDLMASDLPFRVAFPILFTNALRWFRPQEQEFPAQQVQGGAAFPIHVMPADEQVEVRKPSGRKETLKVASNPQPYPDTVEAGFYTFRTQSRTGEFAVNLLSESESQIHPRITARSGSPSESGRGEKIEAPFHLWPFLLGLALALLGIEAFLAFHGAGASFYPWAFRLLALAAVILALINPRMFQAAQALDLIVAVDFSRSVGQEAKDLSYQVLESAGHAKNAALRVGLLFFGQNPIWEFFPRLDFSPAELGPEVGREETNIQAALQAASAQIGEGRQGRVLLISDGNENRAEAARVIPQLRAQEAAVWVLPVNLSRAKNEIYVSDLVLPHEVRSGETFEVKAAVESLYEAPASVKILRDGAILRQQALTLRPGTNRIAVKNVLTEQGNHAFEILVESAHDTLAENNLLQGVVQVKGPPRVLYLHGGTSARRQFARALAAQGNAVVEAEPRDVSLSLAEISTFDLLVLDNVPAYGLSQSVMETVEQYVRDLGGGLVVIGGNQSYGAGGYYRTPLERILPVDMRPPARLDLPHVALLFVLDKSGSMGAGPPGSTKLDLAKAAAMAAADIMNPSDQIGILAFDADWDWVLPFRRVGKGEWISERLASLQSEGGTDLYKAMLEAYRGFAGKAAAIKHLIVLSDGLTDKQDFASLVGKMARDGITVSTVAVGQDADHGLLSSVARDGKGRAYVTIDPETIPQIFTTEALLISRDLLVEKIVQPTAVAAVGPLKGFFQKPFPAIQGYVLTHPKPRADVLMKANDDPLLVSWRYGLGQVTAFTSDLSGRWGKQWVGWEHFPQWAGQLARGAMRQATEMKLRTELKREGDRVKAIVDVFSEEGAFINELKLKGTLFDPGRLSRVAPMRQIAPGRYEAGFAAAERGVYLLTIQEEGSSRETPGVATIPFITPYPKEYRELKPNAALLSRLAEETGGKVLDLENLDDGLKRLFTPDPGKATEARETWWPVSGIGLFLFLADLALRRLPARFSKKRAS